MKAIPLEKPDRRLGAPAEWDHSKDGICHTLEIWDREGWMLSAWLPDADELKRLNEGKPIFLHIQGQRHPVVAINVGVEDNVRK